MSRQVFEVDLKKCPKRVSGISADNRVTLPDMHGNTLYMTHVLAQLGYFDFSEALWSEWYDMYHSSEPLIAEHFDRFLEIITSAYSAQDVPALRYIGDTLADRGRHDFLTLLLYRLLHNNGADFRIMLSNHDLVFWEAFNRTDDAWLQVDFSEYAEDKAYNLKSLEAVFNSIGQLKQSVELGHVDAEAVRQIFNGVVLRRMQLLDCESYDGFSYVFSHAPTSMVTIRRIIRYLKLNPLNEATQSLVTSLNALFAFKKTDFSFNELELWCFRCVMDWLPKDGIELEESGYSHFIHGHDGNEVYISERHHGIDGVLGKPGFERGYLTWFVSTKVPMPASVRVTSTCVAMWQHDERDNPKDVSEDQRQAGSHLS